MNKTHLLWMELTKKTELSYLANPASRTRLDAREFRPVNHHPCCNKSSSLSSLREINISILLEIIIVIPSSMFKHVD